MGGAAHIKGIQHIQNTQVTDNDRLNPTSQSYARRFFVR